MRVDLCRAWVAGSTRVLVCCAGPVVLLPEQSKRRLKCGAGWMEWVALARNCLFYGRRSPQLAAAGRATPR